MLLNVYGGRGITNVWIDDLDVAGAVALEATPAARRRRPAALPPARIAAPTSATKQSSACQASIPAQRPCRPRRNMR